MAPTKISNIISPVLESPETEALWGPVVLLPVSLHCINNCVLSYDDVEEIREILNSWNSQTIENHRKEV